MAFETGSHGATRWSGRPVLFAVAVMNLLTGIGFGLSIGAANFGLDSGLFRRCAALIADGGHSFCEGFPYSPLMQVAAVPLTWLPPTAASMTMTLIGATVLVAGVVVETRGVAAIDRVLVLMAAVTFVPVVYELLLGQTTLLIAATIYPLVRRDDRLALGIALGVALALGPKPMLLPLLAWMLVWRRRALLAAVVTALLLTGIGVATLGLGQYRDWLSVLTGAASQVAAGDFWLSSADKGNHSLWPITPVTFVIACIVCAGTLWAIRRDADRGFVASLLAGLLLAPYSLPYAFSILLLALKPALGFAPRVTRILALTANLVAGFLIALLTAWSLAALASCLPFERASLTRKR